MDLLEIICYPLIKVLDMIPDPTPTSVEALVRFPKTIFVRIDKIKGENYIGYLFNHFSLSPLMDPNDCVKLMVDGHLKAILYGYQINKANGLT